jgi:apolipoprotein N-acyltransferase
VDFAEDFLYAGLSALLLLIANLFSGYWLLSIVAFAPFLYRLIRVNPASSFRLGLMLGLAFFGVNFANNLIIFQFSVIGQVLIGSFAFAVFGWVTGTVQRRLGFSPIITALLWVVLELALIGLGFRHYILLDVSSTPQPYLGGIAALFGTVMISFAIVFLNSLFLVAVEGAIALRKSSTPPTDHCDILCSDTSYYFEYSQKFHLIPESRGPPNC